MKSKVGLVFAAAYIAIALYFIFTQGLFGESFIAIILGLPWSLLFAFFEYFNADGAMLYILVILPMVINTFILYCLGSFFSKKS